MKPGFLATVVGIVANTFLFVIKFGVGLWTSSLSLLSDGVNSLTDIISSAAIFIAVRVSSQEADEGHPFGHRRAEPIAALVVAIFAGIAAFEILRQAVIRLFTGEQMTTMGPWPFVVLGISILVKAWMAHFFRKVGGRINSPAILAGSEESRMDILVSMTALTGIGGSYLGIDWLDSVAAVVISLFIFRAGYRIGMENIDYLMGRSPDPQLLEVLRLCVAEIPRVQGIDRLIAHYVGNYLHVEVEIRSDRNMTTVEAHDLEERVREEVERLPSVDRAYVHLNPI